MLLQAFQDVGQIERRIAQFELPRLYFAEVQNIVHNSAQHIARLFHDFEQIALLVCERRAVECTHHPQHAVQGCADFMAHRSQKA